ncbi:MAG: aminotransferase class I/II-fold pyridoxal phosphate-dependent enzyme [Actinophytocola sp.]|nr:aminotransferase class I/II-fold pyridoxal phosphate-dependent enzyme [Actinophytocola sp.]
MPSGVDLHLDLPAGRGRRVALESALREAIRAGRLSPGESLPASRVLAAELGLARGTVVEAYSQLVAEGYLRARQGAGTEVAEAPGVMPRPRGEPQPRRFAADFQLGRPDLSAFPRQEWLRALRRALHGVPHAELGPGDPRGSLRLREVIADYLGRVRGVLAPPERIVVCTGFTQGLRLVCDAIAMAGATRIGLEDPCLPDHRATATAAGLTVVPLGVDDDGAVSESFGVTAAVLTPAHQAPLGATLATQRRTEFVRLAEEHDAYLVEDDYDGEFRYDGHPIGALQGLAPERVIYAGTASKSLVPGLRLGWLVVPAALLDAVIEAKRRADRGTDVLNQLALAEFISSGGFDRHIRRMRLRYRNRRDAVLDTLRTAAPAYRVRGTAAGLHVVAGLPDGMAEADVLAEAERQSIGLVGLEPFWHENPSRGRGLVIGYGTPHQHGFPSALAKLGEFLRTIGP